MTETKTSRTCSTREAAQQLGVSVRTAQLWVEEGRLNAWKTPGGHRRILVESVARLLGEQRRASSGVGAEPFQVLVVRESEPDRRALQAALAALLPDCQVSAAEDGFEGLIRIGERAPEVLIIDLVVTGLDLVRLVRALRGAGRGGAMLIVVLVASDADRLGLRSHLPDEVVIVATPVDGTELAALVRVFLRNWRRHEEMGSDRHEGAR
ncbi:excisionase family DNA-binding protein [Zoogloea sp.]|uniref:excisionase family DNA-binding protein n=1 Tax=Zoogloea sp. TaxID=49181 RepID=UPI0025D33AE4|nr:excisionase family DNA-binding protein [Zoogloea sp.]MCK6395582.1 excisionase family DNA-binding protein [Zoogloea sp.]